MFTGDLTGIRVLCPKMGARAYRVAPKIVQGGLVVAPQIGGYMKHLTESLAPIFVHHLEIPSVYQ